MNSDYVITLTDVNGVEINSTTYKVASGTAVSLNVREFNIGGKNRIDPRAQPNKQITYDSGTDTATTYSDLKSEINYAGIENPAIGITGSIRVDEKTPGFKVNGTDVRVIDLQLLHDFVTVPNVYYLKDYMGSGNPKLPIQGLIDYTDFFTQWQTSSDNVYTSNGMPVVISDWSISKPYSSDDGLFVDFNINLIEAKE